MDNLIFDLQPHGGITTIWEALISGAIDAPDLDVSFLQSGGHQQRLNELGSAEQTILPEAGSTLLRRFRRVRAPHDTRVFHSSYFRVARGSRVQNVVTVHDCVAEFFDSGLRRFLHLAQKKAALRRASKVICVSENTRKDLLELYPWLPAGDVVVVHNGVDLDIFTPAPVERTRRLLYVGGRNKHKNFQLALDLIASPTATNLGLGLNVVGGGAFTAAETAQIEALGVQDRVRELGGLSRDGIRDAYREAFALIYPSLYEGFGIPPLEAMACGCPVLCSNRSSLLEVVGEAAEVFDPTSLTDAEACLARMSDAAHYDNMVAAGLAHVQGFTQQRMVSKTLDVYRGLLGQASTV